MPSPNTLPTATGECGKSWKWYVSRRFSGRLYVHDSETKTSYWLDDVCLGFKKYNKYLADSRPEQKAGGSGDETDSLQARYQPLCRDFRRGCCRRKSCRFRHEVSHGAPVPEKYAAADAAPVPPLRGQCRDWHRYRCYCEAVLGICEDYARGYCRRGEDCPLRHEEVPLGDCKHFSYTVRASMGTHASFGMGPSRMRSLMPLQRRSHAIADVAKPATCGMRRQKQLMYVTCRGGFAGSLSAVRAGLGTDASTDM